MATANTETHLERGLGLKESVALNMTDMIGIGPFVTISLVIGLMGGPQCLVAWVAGAVLSLLDGCVWAELGAAMPQAGGSYVFLRESYGPARWGRLGAFLIVWQTMFQAPLVMASAAIGFTEYLSYYWPLGPVEDRAIRAAVILLVVVLLYRRIAAIGKISLLLWVGVVGTIVWLIVGGVTHFDARLAFAYPPGAWNFSWAFFGALGAATVKTMYTYLGYYNVCHLGGEIREPERNIPRSIFFSIAGIALLYLAMQTSILGVIPWQEAQGSRYIVSTFVERIYGPGAARVATTMILWIAFASLFSLTLGYSRIPYAAALDGVFFSVFRRVHPTKHFPHISLLALGGTALVFSLLFRLSEVISAIIAMRAVVQFVGGAVGLMLLRRRWPAERFPFKMWLYPLPALVAIVGWLAIFFSTGYFELRGVRIHFWLAGLGMMLIGAIIFLARTRVLGEWPYGPPAAVASLEELKRKEG
jgi:amino acid transporter